MDYVWIWMRCVGNVLNSMNMIGWLSILQARFEQASSARFACSPTKVPGCVSSVFCCIWHVATNKTKKCKQMKFKKYKTNLNHCNKSKNEIVKNVYKMLCRVICIKCLVIWNVWLSCKTMYEKNEKWKL